MLRTAIAIAVAAGSIALASGSANACSVRGNYCGQPDWAASAFEGPTGKSVKGQIKLEHLRTGHYHGPAHVYVAKKIYVPTTIYVKKHVYRTY
jgi:hypothetical protein